MRAMKWQQSDLMTASQQSSSVVSQWLGKGSKEIKSIGKMEAAIYLERATGFSALWVAKGMGPKKVAPALAKPISTGESPGPWTTTPQLLEQLGIVLAQVPRERRKAVADNLAGWALEGGAEHWRQALTSILSGPSKLSSSG